MVKRIFVILFIVFTKVIHLFNLSSYIILKITNIHTVRGMTVNKIMIIK